MVRKRGVVAQVMPGSLRVENFRMEKVNRLIISCIKLSRVATENRQMGLSPSRYQLAVP